MDILGQSALLVSVISFALGLSVLARNVRNILFLAFASLTTLISAWAVSFFLAQIWEGFGFYRFHLFFNIWLAPAGLLLIRVMMKIQDSVSKRLLDVSVMVASLLTLALIFQLESTFPFLQLIYFSPISIVLQVIRLMWIDRNIEKGIQTPPKVPTVGIGRKNLIYLGALVVMATSVMDHVPWVGQILPSFGNLALAAYLFFLSQAITQQRLLNISALFSRFLVLVVVALTLTGIYTLLVAWIERDPGLFFLNSFIASFLILILLDPLRTLVTYFTQILLTKKHRHLEQTLREAQQRLTGMVDLGSLSHGVLSTVEHILEPQWAAFFVLRGNGTKFRRVRSLGQEPEGKNFPHPLKEILAQHSLIQFCEEQARTGKFPVVLDQLIESEIDRSASRSLREKYSTLMDGLAALGADLLIPLLASGKMLGFVVLSISAPPQQWGNNWGFLPIIYRYFEHAAQTLQNMEVYARQREKERLAAIGVMAAGLAHEIRNPLGAIKGAAQFLDPSKDRPESQFLKVIIEETDRLNKVVTQFLDYSKPPSVDVKKVDLSHLVEKTVKMLTPSIPDKIDLKFFPSKLPSWVMGSPEQLHQVLINLIQNAQNAVEKKPSGSIRVSVEAEELPQGSEVVLMVEDTGCGIKKENMEKLFIPFFTTSPRGTGLGLSISQKIVEAHRGRIDVSSEEGRFTRVFVVLPSAKE